MGVSTAPAGQVHGNGRSRFVAAPSRPSRPSRPRYQCRAVQTTPAWEMVTDVMAVDLEGCQRYGAHHVGSFSAVNLPLETVYDVFADHGGWRTKQQYITALPPKGLNLGVDWPDLNPANGARPIREVIENAVQLMVGHTIIFHDAGADMRMLNNSAAMCGIEIPWDKITVRDTQRFHGWQRFARGHQGPSLRDCVAMVLKIPNFQGAGHTSRDDAARTMELYLREKAAMERQYAGLPLLSHAPSHARLLSGGSADTSSGSSGVCTTETRATSPSIDGLTEAMSEATFKAATMSTIPRTAGSSTSKPLTFAAVASTKSSTELMQGSEAKQSNATVPSLFSSTNPAVAPSESHIAPQAALTVVQPPATTASTSVLVAKPAVGLPKASASVQKAPTVTGPAPAMRSWAQVAQPRTGPSAVTESSTAKGPKQKAPAILKKR